MITAVLDSSTLILLTKIDLVKELYNYANKLLIPKEVYGEVVVKGKIKDKLDALIAEKLIKGGKIKVKSVKNNKLMKELMQNFKFDKGETEAIALTIQEKAMFLGTDDKEAMKACKVYGIKFVTALALLVKLVQDKRLSKEEALFKLNKLKNIGYYSKEILNSATKEMEKWNK